MNVSRLVRVYTITLHSLSALLNTKVKCTEVLKEVFKHFNLKVEVTNGHGSEFSVWSLADSFACPQMPGQPVTAAGPDHNKSLEKPELYPSLFQGPDQTKVLPATPTPSAQIYSPAPNFTAGRSNEVYR